MGLRFDPVGGGQFKQAVKSIIEAERQPIQVMEARKAKEAEKMKLFQDFKARFTGLDGLLEAVSTFKKFRELKADLGNGKDAMSVTLDKERAETGTYEILIEQLARRSSAISNGFTDPDELLLGIGYVIGYLPNGETYELFIDEEDASLHGIAHQINQQRRSPVQASVIKDLSDPDRPWRMILTAKRDGYDDQIDFPELYFLDPVEEFYFMDDREAENAFVEIDGFPIESDGNQIKDFLEGVNVQLQAALPDDPFYMVITEDYEKIAEKVGGVVEQLNKILEFINKQNQIDAETDTKSTFAGDVGLTNIEYRIRNIMHHVFPSVDPEDEEEVVPNFISELGIEFQRNGMLTFKKEKFVKIMQDDFGRVADIFTSPEGFVTQMRDFIRGYTQSFSGLLAVKEQAIKSRIKQMDTNIENKERILEQRQKALVEKFSRLQATLGGMQRQQQYLSASLGGAAGGGNLVQQLLGG